MKAEPSSHGPGPSSSRATERRWPALLAASLGATLSFLTACDAPPSGSTPPAVDPPLARVGNHSITLDDLQREAERRLTARRPVPPKEQLLQEMVEELALLQRARDIGLDQEPAVAREIQTLLARRLLERELTPRLAQAEVSQAEIEARYRRDLDRYTQPGRDRIAILFLEAPAKASSHRRSEATTRLEEARRRILAHPAQGGRGPAAFGFGNLAIEFSDDQASRHRGGDIGWLEPGNFNYRWPRPVLEAAFALPKGGITDVIETEAGPYLAMKTDSRPPAMSPLKDVESAIRHALQTEKRRDLEEAYRREVLAHVGTTVRSDLLASVALLATNTQPPHVAQHLGSPLPDLPAPAGENSLLP